MNGVITNWLFKKDCNTKSIKPSLVDLSLKPKLTDVLARFIMIEYTGDKTGEIFERKTPDFEMEIFFTHHLDHIVKTTANVYSEDGTINLHLELVRESGFITMFTIKVLDYYGDPVRIFRHQPKEGKPGFSLFDLTKSVNTDLNNMFNI